MRIVGAVVNAFPRARDAVALAFRKRREGATEAAATNDAITEAINDIKTSRKEG